MYYAKFVGGPCMGRMELMPEIAPVLNFPMLERIPIHNPTEPDQPLPITILRYELRHVMGDGKHKFCFYAQSHG